MQKVNIIIFVVVCIISAVDYASAAWQGPTAVVAGSWGSSLGQFGLERGDTSDEFPNSVGITASGKIVIADQINGVLHIFGSDGNILREIKSPVPGPGWPSEGWPYSVIVNGECAVVGYVEQTHTFSVTTGVLIGTANNIGGTNYLSDDCTKIYVKQKDWKVYTLAGQLLLASSERPLELGQVQTNTLGVKKYRITIAYPDKQYFLTSDSIYTDYVRDANGNIYGVNSGGVWRFNQCGKEIAELIIPSGEKEDVPIQGSGGRTLALDVDYGAPIVARNGDVYAWRKTDFKYSIVKWTWVNDPNVPTGPDAPSGLTVTPSINGLYLTWTASAQNPGCVTGYEVARATTSGGVFSTVGTVAASVLKYNDTTASAGTTYYYKVRAMAGSEPSPYTAEVSGKR